MTETATLSIRERAQQSASKREYLTGDVPALGLVRMRSLSEGEFNAGCVQWFRDKNFEVIPERKKYDRVKSVQMCLVNNDDSLAFSDSFEDLDILLSLPSTAMDELWEMARKLTRAPIKN